MSSRAKFIYYPFLLGLFNKLSNHTIIVISALLSGNCYTPTNLLLKFIVSLSSHFFYFLVLLLEATAAQLPIPGRLVISTPESPGASPLSGPLPDSGIG